MMRVGVRIGMIDEVSVDYWPSMRNYPQSSEEALAQQAPDDAIEHTAELETSVTHLRAQVSDLEGRLDDEHAHRVEINAYAAELAQRLEEVRRSRSWRLTAPLRRLRSTPHL
jgi:uncharacterized protein YlxW (UPF0749 family)